VADTRVLLLKQTAPARSYFTELAEDLAKEFGPCVALTNGSSKAGSGNLRVIEGPAYRRDSTFSRLWTWLRFFMKAILVVFTTDRHTLLFIVAQPPFLPLIGYFRSLFWRQRYVVWVDDVYPDVLVRSGRIGGAGIVLRALRWLNRRMLGRASLVITIGPHMAKLVEQYTTKPVHVVPTWVDPTNFVRIAKDQNRFAVEHGQVGRLTLLYSGNIGLEHDLSTLVEAAKQLEQRGDIGFMVIGSGPRWGEVQQAAHGLSNFTVLPLVPEEDLPYSLAMAEIAIVALGQGFEGISMPSKTYYNMAAGSAILGLSDPPNDLASVIETADCGVNVMPGDVDSFVAAVQRFSEDKAYLGRCRANASTASETTFSRTLNSERVADLLRPFIQQDAEQ
jgi:colanic acid biosynthesis glycosyl transferase WcaI